MQLHLMSVSRRQFVRWTPSLNPNDRDLHLALRNTQKRRLEKEYEPSDSDQSGSHTEDQPEGQRGRLLRFRLPERRLRSVAARLRFGGWVTAVVAHVRPSAVRTTLELSCEAPKFAGLRQLQLLVGPPRVSPHVMRNSSSPNTSSTCTRILICRWSTLMRRGRLALAYNSLRRAKASAVLLGKEAICRPRAPM